MTELQLTKDVALTASPSILYNNLSCLGDSYAYAHQTDVYLVRPLGPHKVPLKEKDRATITSVTTAHSRGRGLLILTSNAETQIWDAQKEVQLSVVSHGPESETRGVGVVEMADRLFLAIGHGTGEVEFVELGPDFGANILKRQKAHRGGITAIGTCGGRQTSQCCVVSGDTSGELQFWNSQFTAYGSAAAQNDCVTSVVVFNEFVAAGYGSGTIRLFLADSAQLRVDIGAHSRWINAISYDPFTARLATIAEDNLLCVWKMPTGESPKVEFLAHKVHANRLPTGVAWTPDGKSVVVALYDTDKLLVYTP